MSSPASQLSSCLREAAPVARTADEWAGVAAQHLKEGERPQAIDALRAAVSLDPVHGAAGLLITTLHESGDVEEAFARGQRYHREGPRNPRALFRFGWLLAFIGEIDPAQALFRDLVVLDQGGLYEAWGNGELAHLERARGDARAAVSFMERAVAAQPGDMISRVGLAQMMVEAGQASAAVPLLEAELAAQPAARGYGGMPAALVLGWALRLLGHETTANRWLDALESTLLAARPDHAARQLGMEPMQMLRQLAYLAVRGRHEEALELAQRTDRIALYGAPDPRDGMLAPLIGEPRWTALLTRSWDDIDAQRLRLGLRRLDRPAP
jgi:tetratricopeptide (TPR) repeat protein